MKELKKWPIWDRIKTAWKTTHIIWTDWQYRPIIIKFPKRFY